MRRILHWLKPNLNAKTILAMVVPAALVYFVAVRFLVEPAKDILVEHERVDLAEEGRLNAWALLGAYKSLRTDSLVVASWPETQAVLKLKQDGLPSEGTKPAATVKRNLKSLLKDGGSLLNLFQGSSITYLRVRLLDRTGHTVMQVDRSRGRKFDEAPFRDAVKYFEDARRKNAEGATRRAVFLPEPPPLKGKADDPLETIAISAFARVGEVGYVALDLNVADIYRFLKRSRRHIVFLANTRNEVLFGTLEEDRGRKLSTDPVFAEPGESATSVDPDGFRGQYRHQMAFDKLATREARPTGYLSMEETSKRIGFRLPRYDFDYFEAKVHKDAYLAWYAELLRTSSTPKSGPVKQSLDAQYVESVDAKSVELDLAFPDEAVPGSDDRILIRARSFRLHEPRPDALNRVKRKLETELRAVAKQERVPAPEFTRTILCDEFDFQIHRIPFDPENPERHLGFVIGFGLNEVKLDITEAYRKAQWVAILSTAVVLLLAWGIAYWHFSYPLRRLTRVAEGIHQGNYHVELPRKMQSRGDEIGVLTKAFGGMAQQVRSREEDLHRLNADLDNQVKERTIELLEQAEELRAARDQALSAAKATDAFLATVSHELRTPLNHIGGYCQLLEMGNLDDDQRDDLTKVQKAAEHLLNIINDILDVQKIKMGVLPIHPESFHAGKLVREVADAMQGMVRKNRNALKLDNVAALGNIRTDPQRFRQILINLVSNASKFTKDGTITIAGEEDPDPNLLAISVRDTGIGMTADQLQKLFQPFCKISDRAINPEGTGLGLVICKKLAERMGGDITVSSEVGRGSTFTVTIQRYLSDNEAEGDDFDGQDASAVPVAAKPRSTAPGGRPASLTDTWTAAVNKGRRSVLIIDDDPQACEMLSRFLASENLDILVANSGSEGLSVARRMHPAVIMLDVVMPGMDGWSTLAALKTDETTADIPVILVTMLDDERKGYALGASDYITKPVNGTHLAKIVERYCGSDGGTILTVDDNPQDREVVRRILQRDGWTVIEAEHGRAALDKLDGLDIQLILLDLMMPVMDGFEFVEEMRKRNNAKPVPIIVMTAKDPTPSERERLNGMVEKILQKGNFDRALLLREVHHLLDGRS